VSSRKSTSSSPHDACLSFEYTDRQRARIVERSLRPEVGDVDGDRTRVCLARDGTTLHITIEADDLVALRAGFNTWLSLASVAESAGEIPDCP
jgi:KEOPS complex subunit Pcc1